MSGPMISVIVCLTALSSSFLLGLVVCMLASFNQTLSPTLYAGDGRHCPAVMLKICEMFLAVTAK